MQYEIPESRYEDTKNLLAKLAKKTSKLGVLAPVVTWGEEVVETKQKYNLVLDKMETVVSRVYKTITVELAEPIKFSGWTLIGELDHDLQRQGAEDCIINVVPGQNVPEHYRKNKWTCDHCNHKRFRKETFLVQHEDGIIKQVGRSCISDFLGYDVSRFVRTWDYVQDFGRDLDGTLFGAENIADVSEFCTIVSVLIRKNGYASRASVAAEQAAATTASEAWRAIFPKMDKYNKAHSAETYDAITEDDDRLSKELIQYWLNKADVKSGFEMNVHTIIKNNYIPYKYAGYIAGAVQGYLRIQGIEAAKRIRAAKLSASEFVSEVGKRSDFELTVIDVKWYNSDFGTVFVNRMQDANGNVFVWKTGRKLEQGKTLQIKGTVKRHNEYKHKDAAADVPAVKQTELSRCKILGE